MEQAPRCNSFEHSIANGNQLTIEEPNGDITTNTWDGENYLQQVEHPDLSITTYLYDAEGHRIQKDDGVDVTRFIYDGSNILQERDDLGTVEAEFTICSGLRRRRFVIESLLRPTSVG